jgi:xanthine dehydrogenase accessory factor
MITEVLRAALAAAEQGEAFAIATVITAEGSSPGKPGHKMLVHADGRIEGTIGGGALEQHVRAEALARIAGGEGTVLRYSFDPDSPDNLGLLCGGGATIALEIIAPRIRLLLCGGGHVGLAVAQQCGLLGFLCGVVDPREELVSAQRFPAAIERTAADPPAFVRGGGLRRYSHVIILTHNHALDRETLRAVAESGFDGYVGMIGSRRKWAEIRAALRAEGVDDAWLERVHCPIGLEIGAHTPPEIGLAITGEIIREQHDGSA